MPDIKINFQELRGKAREIRTSNNTLRTTLKEIQNKIKGLEASYTSDASDTIRMKIDNETRRIEDYDSVIESFCAFLERTADNYERREGVVNQNADSQFT